MIALNRKFTIQRKGRSSDGQGGYQFIWIDAGSEYGRIRPASAGELISAHRRESQISHVAYFRGAASFHIGERLTLDGRYYIIQDFRNPGGMSRHLEVDCVEVEDGVFNA